MDCYFNVCFGINCQKRTENRFEFQHNVTVLSASLFEKIPILQAFTFTDYNKLYAGNPNQLNLFD